MTLEAEVPAGIRLRGNRELLSQALINLVENAIKYTKGLGRHQRISVRLVSEAGRLRIEVADQGPGIPEADRQRVIDRFVRLDTSRSEPGSGLGLSLVAAVARLHRGEFRIEDNTPGVKAVIDLPAT
jgi:signal transduction histidine kinase